MASQISTAVLQTQKFVLEIRKLTHASKRLESVWALVMEWREAGIEPTPSLCFI